MSSGKRIALIVGAIYIGLIVLTVGIYGFARSDNADFKPQNEFYLSTWFEIGPLAVNKAVLYLVLAAALTLGTMLYVANRMQARPNRVQTAVEWIYEWMQSITRGNMDADMARKWFPFVATLFLFIWYSNLIGYLPLPTNTHGMVDIFGVAIPGFVLYAATSNISVTLVLALIVFVAYNAAGIRAKGPIGYLKGLVPAGIENPGMKVFIFVLEVMSNLMRVIALSVRLFANILAGHMIILFMSGGLAILLGIEALGWIILPAGIAVFLFEVGLVATIQAFIFATLTAIYLGGAVADEH